MDNEVARIKQEAEVQLSLNRTMAENHQRQCEEAIANLAALRTITDNELVKAVVGNPQ